MEYHLIVKKKKIKLSTSVHKNTAFRFLRKLDFMYKAIYFNFISFNIFINVMHLKMLNYNFERDWC